MKTGVIRSFSFNNALLFRFVKLIYSGHTQGGMFTFFSKARP